MSWQPSNYQCRGGCSNNDISTTYSWSPAIYTVGTTTVCALSATNVINPTVSFYAAGTYSFILTATNNGHSCSQSVTFTINPVPSATVGSNQMICLGSSVQLGTTSYGTNTYSWTSSPTTTSYYPSSSVSNPTVTPSVAGTYTFSLTETQTTGGFACTNSNNVTVDVGNVPTSPGLTCSGGSGLTCTSTPSVGYGCDLIFKPTSTVASGTPTFIWYNTDPGYNPTNGRNNMPTTGYAGPGGSYTNSNNTLGTTWTSDYLIPNTSAHLYVISELGGCWSNRLDITYSLSGSVAPDVSTYTAYVCQEGGKITLSSTASSGYTYEWHIINNGVDWIIPNATSSSILVSEVGTYYFISTNTSTGCSYSSSHSVIVSSIPNQVVTPSGPLSTASTLTATSTGYTAWQWYKDGVSLGSSYTSSSLSASNMGSLGSGYYQCLATNNCGQTVGSNIVKYNIVCPTPTLGAVTNPGTMSAGAKNYTTITVNSGTTTIGSTTSASATSVILNSGAVLDINGGSLNMSSCATIVVNSGGTLKLRSGGKIFGCSGWKGIDAKGGAVIQITGGTISDADIALYAEDNANITVSGTTFQFNKTHIAFDNVSGGSITAAGSGVSYSNFYELSSTSCGSMATLSNPSSLSVSTQKMIYIKGITSINIGTNNNFYLNKNSSAMPGSSSNPIDAIEIYNGVSTTINTNTIDGPFTSGCYSENGNTITFTNNVIGKSVSYTTHPYNGLIINQTLACNISSNQFGYSGANNDGIGIQFYLNNSSGTTSTISTNAIGHHKFGIVVAPNQNPITYAYATSSSAINNTTVTQNLQITCNAISNNDVGIIGCGNLLNQRSSTIDASNTFYGSGNHNNDWDILWQSYPSGVSSFNYYYSSSLAPNSSTNCALPTNKYYMNYNSSTLVPIAVTGSGVTLNTASTVSCSPSATMFKTSGIEGENPSELHVKIFPNPFTESFNVAFDEPIDGVVLEVIDMTGRIIKTINIKNDLSLIVDASHFAPAMYIVQIKTHDGKVSRHSLVKVGF